MPYEAEDVYARAIPTYRHIAGHHYELTSARITAPAILTSATSAHLAIFNRDILLTKSPFNSLRIRQLEEIWGDRLRYIHIVRDQHDIADSLRRNDFGFDADGQPMTAESAQAYFAGMVQRDAPPRRSQTVNHRALARSPEDVIREVVGRTDDPQPGC